LDFQHPDGTGSVHGDAILLAVTGAGWGFWTEVPRRDRRRASSVGLNQSGGLAGAGRGSSRHPRRVSLRGFRCRDAYATVLPGVHSLKKPPLA
jgi:hypothetical protein